AASYAALVAMVADRPGHDRRYAIDATKIRAELGWRPAHDFDAGIRRTVAWYLAHRDWCETVQADRYRRERLGLSGAAAIGGGAGARARAARSGPSRTSPTPGTGRRPATLRQHCS